MARRSRKNIGLIGLGIIGSRVAAGLRGAGYKVYVWSRTPRAEPNFLGSPAKVAESCEIIQIFVSDAEAVYETIERLSGSLTAGHVIICNSTIGPSAVREAARRVEAHGAKFVDAPFTGSREAADAKELVYYMAGEPAQLDRVEPVLAATSKAIVRIGEVGQAAIVKVALNMLVAVSAQTLAEAMAVVRQSGVEEQKFVDALSHHGVRSGLTDMKVPKMLERDYEPHFSLKHMFKDVQLAIHMANALDLDIPATTATAGVMYGGLNRGWGDQDFSVVSEIFPHPEIAEEPPEPVEEKLEEPSTDAIKPEQPKVEDRPEKVGQPEAVVEKEKVVGLPPKSGAVVETIPVSEPKTPEPKVETTAAIPETKAIAAVPVKESAASDFPPPPAPVAETGRLDEPVVETDGEKASEEDSTESETKSPPRRPRSGGLLGALFGARK